MALPAVLRELGVNPAKVLAEAGFDLKLFNCRDNRISYAARGRLLAQIAALVDSAASLCASSEWP